MLFLALIGFVLVIMLLFLLLFVFGFIHIALDLKFISNKPDIAIKIFLWKIRLAKFQLADLKMNAYPFKLFFRGEIDTAIKDAENEMTFEKEGIKKLLQQWESLTSKIKKEGNLPNELLSLFRIHDIKWYTILGLDEAPLTAFAVGIAWSLKYTLIGRLLEWLEGMERPVIDIRPSYNELTFKTHIKCMITFRLGKAILAAYRIAKIRKRRRVGKCQNIQYKA